KNRSSHHVRGHLRNFVFPLAVGFLLLMGPDRIAVHAQSGIISDPVYQLISQRIAPNETGFAVYLDQDSGFNHGFPSGLFAKPSPTDLGPIHVETGCIDDPNATNGCSADLNAL